MLSPSTSKEYQKKKQNSYYRWHDAWRIRHHDQSSGFPRQNNAAGGQGAGAQGFSSGVQGFRSLQISD